MPTRYCLWTRRAGPRTRWHCDTLSGDGRALCGVELGRSYHAMTADDLSHWSMLWEWLRHHVCRICRREGGR